MATDIHPAVAKVAARWGLDPELVQAVVVAEGGTIAIVRAVQCSLPDVITLDAALEVTCRSITHRLWEYVKTNSPAMFVNYLASKWAPVGAANDPHNLNSNWPRNVIKSWLPLKVVSVSTAPVQAEVKDGNSALPSSKS